MFSKYVSSDTVSKASFNYTKYPGTDLFFRTFTGKSGEVRKTASEKYRVLGRKLEGKILEAVEALEEELFSD